MAQRWNDLLFAHWPIPVGEMARLLPAGLEVDPFDGYAWVGVVPFWMDQVRTRAAGERCITVPGTATFCELNLRTYVRSPTSNLRGVYFFSLDAASALAVIGARTLFHLPYFFASMRRRIESDGTIEYRSNRLLTGRRVRFKASYRGLGEAGPSRNGTLEHFLTERYCLYAGDLASADDSRLWRGEIHHQQWPLQPAEAEIMRNTMTAPLGLRRPNTQPLLHFARCLDVAAWPPEPM